jgi:hypothetical protein
MKPARRLALSRYLQRTGMFTRLARPLTHFIVSVWPTRDLFGVVWRHRTTGTAWVFELLSW